jgi:hypothetical protein
MLNIPMMNTVLDTKMKRIKKQAGLEIFIVASTQTSVFLHQST